MRPLIQQMVENHLGKTDGLVKAIETAMGGIGSSLELASGHRRHFFMAVIDAFPRQPAFFVAADAPGSQEIRMRGL
ncbi:hypothetical protein D3C87_1621140 [compost metagenome]